MGLLWETSSERKYREYQQQIREMLVGSCQSQIDKNRNENANDLDNEWHRAYICDDINGKPTIQFHELEIKNIEDGLISSNYFDNNQRLTDIANRLLDNNYEICRNVFLIIPETIFYCYSFYLFNDINYLHYNYDYSSYRMKPYYEESSKIADRYKNDFNKVFVKFNTLLNEDYNVSINDTKAVAWKIIKKVSHKYFEEKWDKDYDELCKKSPSECNSIEELLDTYCKSDIVNPYDTKNIALFTHLTIQCNGINSKSFVFAFDTMYNLIIEHKKKLELDVFRDKINSREQEINNSSKYSMDEIDLMNGNEFEHFVGDMFSKMGYSAEVTKHSGDQGIDVIAEKNGKKIGIQAKCYSNSVGNSAIQEAVAGKNYYNCDKVIVVTNNSFTNPAIELAQVNDVILWDRNILKEKISELF